MGSQCDAELDATENEQHAHGDVERVPDGKTRAFDQWTPTGGHELCEHSNHLLGSFCFHFTVRRWDRTEWKADSFVIRLKKALARGLQAVEKVSAAFLFWEIIILV